MVTADMKFRQDDSAHMPLGLFCGDVLVTTVPSDLELAHRERDRVAAEQRRPVSDYEVLVCCQRHPTVSAVDCLDCEPLRED